MDFKKIGIGASFVLNAIMVAVAGALVTLLFSLQQKVANLEASDLSQWGNMADIENHMESDFQLLKGIVTDNAVDKRVHNRMLNIIEGLLNPDNVDRYTTGLGQPSMMYQEESRALAPEISEDPEEMAEPPQIQEKEFPDMEQRTQQTEPEPVTGEELDRYIKSRKNQSRK